MKFTIEAQHSRWGAVKLTAEKHIDKPNITAMNNGENYVYYSFRYPSGEWMGSLDYDAGGALGHPDQKVDEFMRFYCIDTLDYDNAAYCELESILVQEIMKRDPNFFRQDAREAHGDGKLWRCPPVRARFECRGPDGHIHEQLMVKVPCGLWMPCTADFVPLSLEKLKKDGIEPYNKRGFASPYQFRQKLEELGYTNFAELQEEKPDVNRLATF